MSVMAAYYNEVDGYCCDWLSNLMDAGQITAGKIDDRSIVDVRSDDVLGYERVHFFAGIGGWDYALSLSGYSGPVWTGSCPCQPFSVAGKGKAADDERHLWPAWFSLIRQCRPPIIFGEQVEAAIGWGWLDVVFADLEAEGYACGAAVLPAASVGAPHIRQRVWFVAQSGEGRCTIERPTRLHEDRQSGNDIVGCEQDGELANAGCERWQSHGHDVATASGGDEGEARQWQRLRDDLGTSNAAGELADADIGEHAGQRSPWAASSIDWLPCTDGKARPVEPGTFPLAHGISGRVGRLRAYGNAIVPQVAAEFIRSACDG
jgi:DNA (cytosine-5)-methyltransferase 1